MTIRPTELPTQTVISSDTLLGDASAWVRTQHHENRHNNSIWNLRYNGVTLKPLDDEMGKHGFYVRFMDDWVIRLKSKHPLRKVIKLPHKILNAFKLKMHPDKTYIGCIKKGLDFLGVHFDAMPTIAKASLERHRAKLAQGASATCIGDHVARWTSWCKRVLKCRVSVGPENNQNHPMELELDNRKHSLGNINKECQIEKISAWENSGFISAECCADP